MQRAVTGHTPEGKSVFTSVGEPPRVLKMTNLPGPDMTEVWATAGVPDVPVDEVDPTIEMASLVPEPGETRFRIMRVAPTQEFVRALEKGIDMEAARQEALTKFPGLAEAMETADPGMHTTDTVDYGIVISGEIWLELDDGAEVHLKQGDCVVQNGTRHAWRNKSSETCVMAFVMIGAKRR